MIVQAGKHQFRPYFQFLYFKKTLVETLVFTPSCKYQIGHPDQLDWNKLFGIGFFPGHRVNSYRFGWRYDHATGTIETSAYWYQEKQRMDHAICRVPFNKKIRFSIHYQDGLIIWNVGDQAGHITRGAWPWIGYRLGPYFGGNRRAPHTMTIHRL